MKPRLGSTGVAVLLLGVAWVSAWPTPSAAKPKSPPRIVSDRELRRLLPDVRNAACPLPGMLTGGQIDSTRLVALGKAGYRTVLDLRMPEEPRGFDEAAVAKARGLRYVSLPIANDTIPDATFDAFRALVREPEPMLVHCRSGNRVGAVLIPALILDRGMAPDSARAVARRVGLASEALEKAALDYVNRQGSREH